MPINTSNGATVPVGSDPYNLTADLLKLANSLNVVTPVASDQEEAALPAVDGKLSLRVDRGGLIRRFVDGAWRSNYTGPFRSWVAIANVNVPGGPSHSYTVNLPAGLFTIPPIISLTHQSAAGVGHNLYAFDVTTTSFKIGFFWAGNTSAYTARVAIRAEQVSPTSAAGSL